MTGANGIYIINGNRFVPSAAFTSFTRERGNGNELYNSLPPDLVIEVPTPEEKPRDMRLKLHNYLIAGIVVWIVDIDEETVEVYVPGQSPRILSKTETFTGDPVLPGFTLLLSEMFDYGAPEDG